MVFCHNFKINFLIGSAIIFGLAASSAHADQTLNSYSINTASFGKTTDAASASITGKSMGSLTTLALSAGHEFNQTVSRRQNKLHSFSNGVGTSEVFFGEAGNIEVQKNAEKVFDAIGKQFGLSGDEMGSAPQFWTTDFKRKGIVGSDSGHDTYNYDLSGFAGGMDVKAGTSWNFGLAAGYTRASSRFEALARTATAVDAYQAALYATYEHELGSIDSNVSFNKFDNQSARSIVGSGLDSTADAKGKGYQIAWTLSAMGHGEYNKFNLTPITGFTFTHLHRGGLSEDGAGLYNLSSAASNSTSLKPMLGIDIARNYVYQSDIEIKPEIYGIYRYETMDTTESTTNHLQQLNSLTSTSSTALSRHSMQIGSSVSMKIGERFTSKLQFDTDLQPSSHSYSGVFKVNYSW